MNLILASKSPRRIELLKLIHPEFSVEPAKSEEIVPEGATPAETVMALAKAKAEEIAANHPDAQIVHEAAIGRINGDQLLKLCTLGLTEEEAEKEIIDGFLK